MLRLRLTATAAADLRSMHHQFLRGLSLYRAVLKPLGLRAPHWHPNANELTYCLNGEALVTIFSNGSIHTRFRYGRAKCFSSHPAIFITSKIQLQLRRNLSSPSP